MRSNSKMKCTTQTRGPRPRRSCKQAVAISVVAEPRAAASRHLMLQTRELASGKRIYCLLAA